MKDFTLTGFGEGGRGRVTEMQKTTFEIKIIIIKLSLFFLTDQYFSVPIEGQVSPGLNNKFCKEKNS